MTCLVFDHGAFFPVAQRLARDFGRVLYHTPWEKAYPVINDGILGFGFENIERCVDFWTIKDEIDLFVFPDLFHMGLQQELRRQGFRVWGANSGMRLEIDRQFFMRKLDELGLAVAPHQVVMGLANLAVYLKDKKDQFIKVSKWRGSWETKHWRSWDEDAHCLDCWGVDFGGMKDHIPFLVFEKIDTKLEIGADTYCVHGKWPQTMLHGIERKDESYIAAVTATKDMPEELTSVMEAFSGFLASCNYASQWSMEVRVTEDEAYFIDATTRGGLPSTASFLNAKNVSEILYAGANGELVEPNYGYQFSAECMVKIKGEPSSWDCMILPDSVSASMHPQNCCLIDDKIWFPLDNKHGESREIGWLSAQGDTPAEAITNIIAASKELPSGVTACVESLAGVLKEIKTEQDSGIEFTDKPIPDPAIVVKALD